jgi:hypothetical protein
MDSAEKLLWPMLGRSFLFGLAADALIVTAIVMYFGEPENRPMQIGVGTILIVVVESVLNMKNWLIRSLWVHWFGKGYTETLVLEALRKMSLPPPDEYHRRNFEYLSDLADDPEASADDRVMAASTYTAFKTQWSGQGITRSVLLEGAANEAFSKWVAETPKRRH